LGSREEESGCSFLERAIICCGSGRVGAFVMVSLPVFTVDIQALVEILFVRRF